MSDNFQGLQQLAYAAGKPSASALLKQQPQDFIVDEELGFDCTGSGEHLFLRIRKTGVSTTELARELARALQIREVDVGYSGMKDRQAETTQWFSVVLPTLQESRLDALELEGIEILESQRNERKLKIGSHRANHFQLNLKDVEGSCEELEDRLKILATQGVPNYFGLQRFGKNLSNLQQAQTLFSAPKEKGGKGRKRRGMLYSAARSYLFNQILSARIEQDNWQRFVRGDVLNLDGTSRCFSVEPEDWDEELQGRLDSLDIHITGILMGNVASKDKYVTNGEAADIEDAVLKQFPILGAGLCQHGLSASRRPLRFKVSDLRWQWLDTGTLALQFSLPRGAYATSLLREVCSVRETSC